MLKRWLSRSLSLCLILISGCSSHLAARTELDDHQRMVVRAQNPAEPRQVVQPAVWRNAVTSDRTVENQIQVTRYAPSGATHQNDLTTNESAFAVQPTAPSALAYGQPAGHAAVGTFEPNRLPADGYFNSIATPQPSMPGQGSFPQNDPRVAPVQTRPQMYLPLTLRETIESALADSSVVKTLEGRVNVALITPADVEIADWNVNAQEGQFQPRLSGNYDATKVDQPPNAFFGPGISANTRRDVVDAGVSVYQPMTTGGLVSVGIEPATAYLYFPDGVGAGQFNPLYSTDYVLRVNQPVLRGAGSNIALTPIRIAQIQANESRYDLEEVLNSQIRSLTEGYWRLYAAHMQLQAIRSVIPLAEESVRVETLRLKADRSILADVARAQVQLDGFRRTESSMQGIVRKRVLQLRQLMGGQPMVEPLLLPSEQPLEIPPPNDSTMLIQTALQTRPALNAQRERLNERQQLLGLARNNVLPSVDVRGEYRMNGLAERLDDSFDLAASRDYTDWTLGFGVDVPIGNKTARSRRKMAELAVARDQMRLNAQEQNVAFEVTELVSDLEAAWQRMQISKRQSVETQEWLRVSRIRYTQPPASNSGQDWLLLALTDLQSAMRSYVEAITDLSDAVADYNTLLADLQQAQGISVYEWRQNQATLPALGGHTGMMPMDYRSNPAFAVQQLQKPNAPVAAGHTFGQLPQPQP